MGKQLEVPGGAPLLGGHQHCVGFSPKGLHSFSAFSAGPGVTLREKGGEATTLSL